MPTSQAKSAPCGSYNLSHVGFTRQSKDKFSEHVGFTRQSKDKFSEPKGEAE